MAELTLRRRLGLANVVLYGLGVTIGAGIYALVGSTISLAGIHAPVAFVLAALIMVFPAACFAELTGRFPFAAAEARFVREGFGSRTLFVAVGLGVATIGIVAAAAIAHGAVSYLSRVIDLPPTLLLAFVICGCATVASLGIKSSTGIAGAMTVVEIGGLVLIIGGGFWAGKDILGQAVQAVPATLSLPVWSGIMAASLLAFFAFIGFENIDSIAEETTSPQRTLATAIFLTLLITTVLYLGVVLTVLATNDLADITSHPSPLTLTFTRNTGLPEIVLVAIATVATLNGIIVQILMAGRVIYGMARDGELPVGLARLSARTATPVRATALCAGVALIMALALPIVELAELTSAITLLVFALVCLSLARIKARGTPVPEGTFQVYRWVPPTGAIVCLGLLVAGVLPEI
ncbi:APC family permease [Tabrizicola sp. YIM 78059]|uniref:APC family permease n=1 Tax=Tabrizicola sp. YIM 78059 TaxID=2529861 RepID=UPI0010AB41D5|nr:APC family permease [Tabrizicola sp. YIM 78059]